MPNQRKNKPRKRPFKICSRAKTKIIMGVKSQLRRRRRRKRRKKFRKHLMLKKKNQPNRQRWRKKIRDQMCPNSWQRWKEQLKKNMKSRKKRPKLKLRRKKKHLLQTKEKQLLKTCWRNSCRSKSQSQWRQRKQKRK